MSEGSKRETFDAICFGTSVFTKDEYRYKPCTCVVVRQGVPVLCATRVTVPRNRCQLSVFLTGMAS